MKQKLNNTSSFRNFDWDKAKTFYYVAHLGSFTKCAEFLNLSQPALSRQISSLEKSLGSCLFIRKSKGLEMTRKGEELLEIISDTFYRLGEFTRKDKIFPERGTPRTIRIGIQRGYEYLVIGGLESYQLIHPYLTFEIMQDIPEKSLEILDLDIAFRTYGAYAYVGADYTFLPLEETGKNVATGKDITLIASKCNTGFTEMLYMVILSVSKGDEELQKLYNHLKREDKE